MRVDGQTNIHIQEPSEDKSQAVDHRQSNSGCEGRFDESRFLPFSVIGTARPTGNVCFLLVFYGDVEKVSK